MMRNSVLQRVLNWLLNVTRHVLLVHTEKFDLLFLDGLLIRLWLKCLHVLNFVKFIEPNFLSKLFGVRILVVDSDSFGLWFAEELLSRLEGNLNSRFCQKWLAIVYCESLLDSFSQNWWLLAFLQGLFHQIWGIDLIKTRVSSGLFNFQLRAFGSNIVLFGFCCGHTHIFGKVTEWCLGLTCRKGSLWLVSLSFKPSWVGIPKSWLDLLVRLRKSFLNLKRLFRYFNCLEYKVGFESDVCSRAAAPPPLLFWAVMHRQNLYRKRLILSSYCIRLHFKPAAHTCTQAAIERAQMGRISTLEKTHRGEHVWH